MIDKKMSNSILRSKPLIHQLDNRRPEVSDELLAGITDRLVKKFRPYKLILFGSYAWGKPGKDSDIDLFMIMDSMERPGPRSVPVAIEARVPFLPMDLLVYTPAEVASRLAVGDDFIERIMTSGRILYER